MDATLRAILEEVGRRPLRASVITATALMDTMLEKVISAFIIEDLLVLLSVSQQFSVNVILSFAFIYTNFLHLSIVFSIPLSFSTIWYISFW